MNNKVKDLTLAAMFLAIAVVMPRVIHFAGPHPGRTFLPLFSGVSLSALILPLKYTLLIAVLSPLTSHVLSGMPPIPLLYFMILELMVFGTVATFLKLNSHFKIFIGLLASRVSYIIFVLVATNILKLPLPPTSVMALFGWVLTSVPGIILHTIIAPIIEKLYRRSGVYE